MIDYSRIVRGEDGVWRGTTADWAAVAPVTLAAGHTGADTTTGRVKLGDGVTAWSKLAAVNPTATRLPGVSEEWLLDGSPAGTFRQTIQRKRAVSVLSALTSGVMYSTAICLEEGDVVTDLTFRSVGAAVTPTNWWFALYDAAATPALVAQSADQTTTAWGANTSKTLALSSPYTVPTTGIYYASIMMAAGTVVTLLGQSWLVGSNGPIVTGQKTIAQTSGAALTTTAPATIASATAAASLPYVIAKQ